LIRHSDFVIRISSLGFRRSGFVIPRYPAAMFSPDTITAISSAAGAAARMIVRVSGPEAVRVVATLTDPVPAEGGRAVRGILRLDGLDLPAWLYGFRGPRSYTGEDLIELHVPGNPLVARVLLDALVRAGARHAEPGEFTARAYFHGRLDLTEAEGVAATIAANGEQELAAARQLMSGELARRLRPAMDAIAGTLALTEVGIDFSDEDVSFLSPDDAAARIGAAERSLRELLAGAARFERLSHEPQFVLIGRPNAGKSTLLNALAGRERAVTSPVAGTTRDVLTAEVVLPRGIVRVTDVAGVDEPEHEAEGDVEGDAHSPEAAEGDAADQSPRGVDDPVRGIEAQMRRRALRAAAEADFVVLVRDATDPQPPLPPSGPAPRRLDLTVRSKADLIQPNGGPGMGGKESQAGADAGTTILVSAVSGRNLDRLRGAMDRLAFGEAAGRSTLALNARHLGAIGDAIAALGRAAACARGGNAEVLALELREALDALGGVLGHVTPDDLLGRIFSSFCIGK
jgi:tRNA modification GTPase